MKAIHGYASAIGAAAGILGTTLQPGDIWQMVVQTKITTPENFATIPPTPATTATFQFTAAQLPAALQPGVASTVVDPVAGTVTFVGTYNGAQSYTVPPGIAAVPPESILNFTVVFPVSTMVVGKSVPTTTGSTKTTYNPPGNSSSKTAYYVAGGVVVVGLAVGAWWWLK